MGTPLTIDVIIPARDARATIAACLIALASNGVPGPGRRLIVIDDGSRDGTAAIARAHGAEVLDAGGRGPAAARNVGLRASRADVVVFLDADTEPLAGWLTALIRPFDDPAVVAVKGRYYTRQHAMIARFTQLEFEEKYAQLTKRHFIDFVDTGTAAFRRHAIADIGGFDESFHEPSAEDVDVGYRLLDRGGKIVFAAGSGVWHRHPESLLGFLRRKIRYGRHRAVVYRTHPDKAVVDTYTTPATRPRIVLAALAAVLVPFLVAPAGRYALGAMILAHAALSWPRLMRVWPTDRSLALAVPLLTFATSLAQAGGLVRGVIDLVRSAGRSSRATPVA